VYRGSKGNVAPGFLHTMRPVHPATSADDRPAATDAFRLSEDLDRWQPCMQQRRWAGNPAQSEFPAHHIIICCDVSRSQGSGLKTDLGILCNLISLQRIIFEKNLTVKCLSLFRTSLDKCKILVTFCIHAVPYGSRNHILMSFTEFTTGLM
jgi:hypothetical protein